MFISSTIFFLLMLAVGIATSFFDYYTSTKFDERGQFESNKINRDPQTGYFSRRRFIAFHVALLGAGVAAYIFMGGYAGLWYSAIGLINIVTGFRNASIGKRSRARQIEILTSLSEAIKSGREEQVDLILSGIIYRSFPAVRYAALFPFVASTEPDQWTAFAEINRKLCDLAVKPESEWFKEADIVPTF